MVWTQLLFNTVIPKEGIFRFKVKVTVLKDKSMIIGVLDRRKKAHHRSSYSFPFALGYNSFIGQKMPSGDPEGGGFSSKQLITT